MKMFVCPTMVVALCTCSTAAVAEQPAESAGPVVERPVELVASKPQDKPESMNAESAEPKPTDAKERARQLAKLTARVYRQATELSFEARVTYGEPPERIRCVVIHGLQKRCHLRVYDENDRLFYELQIWPDATGVRIQEKNYRGDETQDYVLSLTDFAPYKWDPRCLTGINGCAFGGYLNSWVGCKSHWATFWEETISGGECVGTEDVNGHPCDIVETHRVKGLIERIYLDRKTHIVRRWLYDYNGVIKDRVYSNIRLVGGFVQQAD
ncbi:MAG: hypothetical protein JXQ75_13300 [Phycisphaerae bacterium]|nr:hypothetical protein [Phycisphaerae bacterium]